ncbi:hypothetical protein QZH41_002462, partial [Actinostola sp. cb2023]
MVRSTDYPKMFERVKYKGNWMDCDGFHTVDQAGNGCNCHFVACTGTRECTAGAGFHCQYFTNDNVGNEDVKEAFLFDASFVGQYFLVPENLQVIQGQYVA